MNNLYIVQSIPNWCGWQIFNGLAAKGDSGYLMDSWWNIGNDVSYHFTTSWYTTDPKYIGIIFYG